jgi:hypothetical protein
MAAAQAPLWKHDSSAGRREFVDFNGEICYTIDRRRRDRPFRHAAKLITRFLDGAAYSVQS